jgi:hypothetical protein
MNISKASGFGCLDEAGVAGGDEACNILGYEGRSTFILACFGSDIEKHMLLKTGRKY